jgi:hypothetical protein
MWTSVASQSSGFDPQELAAVQRVLWAIPFAKTCGIVESSLTSSGGGNRSEVGQRTFNRMGWYFRAPSRYPGIWG